MKALPQDTKILACGHTEYKVSKAKRASSLIEEKRVVNIKDTTEKRCVENLQVAETRDNVSAVFEEVRKWYHRASK